MWFALILLCVLISSATSDSTPVAVFVLARHGERYPCHHLPNLDYPKDFLHKTCQLTPNGAKQHYELGKFVRSRYGDLLTPQDFNLVSCQSIQNDSHRLRFMHDLSKSFFRTRCIFAAQGPNGLSSQRRTLALA